MTLMDDLNRMGAVYDGQHFVYKKGGHGPAYVHPDTFLPRLARLPSLGALLGDGFIFDTVIGPAFGGNYLALATALGSPETLLAPNWVATEKSGDDFVVAPDRMLEPLLENAKVLIVEDLLTTGSTVAKVIQLVRSHGGHVVGVSAVVNRGGVTKEELGVPQLEAIVNISLDLYEAADCPLCRDEVPIVVDSGLGHGAEYQAIQPDYKGGYIRLLGK